MRIVRALLGDKFFFIIKGRRLAGMYTDLQVRALATLKSFIYGKDVDLELCGVKDPMVRRPVLNQVFPISLYRLNIGGILM